MPKRATIYSLAKDLGLHPATVSRAFSRPNLVRDSVRERILARAGEVDYRPNTAARGLITGRLGMVGLLIPDVENPFFPPLVRAIQNAGGAHDLNVLLLDSDLRPKVELDLIQRMRSQVDGLILASPRSSLPKIAEVVGDTPLVVINRSAPGLSTVSIQNSTALREAGRYLVSLGHRSIALLRGPSGSWAARQRSRAVKGWAAKEEVKLTTLGPFDASYDGGLEAAAELAELPATAAFAFDDLMAAGVVAGLGARGIQVPRDLSLVGCDDVLLARTLNPALTTVTAPVEPLGRTAIELLIARRDQPESPPDSVMLEGTLTIRASADVPPSTVTATPRRSSRSTLATIR